MVLSGSTAVPYLGLVMPSLSPPESRPLSVVYRPQCSGPRSTLVPAIVQPGPRPALIPHGRVLNPGPAKTPIRSRPGNPYAPTRTQARPRHGHDFLPASASSTTLQLLPVFVAPRRATVLQLQWAAPYPKATRAVRSISADRRGSRIGLETLV